MTKSYEAAIYFVPSGKRLLFRGHCHGEAARPSQKDEREAVTILNAKNESFRQPVLNLQIARA
jgi:hypothetical protein